MIELRRSFEVAHNLDGKFSFSPNKKLVEIEKELRTIID
jgi:hypothetical protein